MLDFIKRMDAIAIDCLNYSVGCSFYTRIPSSTYRGLWSILRIHTTRLCERRMDSPVDYRGFTAHCVALAICVALRGLYPESGGFNMVKLEEWVIRCFDANRLLEEDLFEFGSVTRTYETVKIR